MIKQTLNKEIPTPIAIAIVLILVIMLGSFVWLQYGKMWTETSELSEIEIPETVQYDPLLVSEDLIFSQGFNDTGRPWPPEEETWSEELKQNPLCGLRKLYCKRVGYQYADFGCDCFIYQFYDSFNTYIDNEERFTVYYSKLWQQNTENINFSFISQAKMSMDRNGASCRFIYGIVDEEAFLSISNASTTTVNIKDKELSQITLPFDRELSDEKKAAGYTQSKLITVPHFPYPVSKFGFVITSGDKQPLVEACVNEFRGIIRSRIINYPSTKLTSQSTGILNIQDIFPSFKTPTDPRRRITLIFENTATGKEEAIVADVFSQTQYLADPFLIGSKLYYFDSSLSNPVIKIVDIFTGEDKTIPLPYDEAKPIHSFFIEGDVLYYLSGEFCNEYLAKCNLELKRYNIKSGIVEHLASGVKSRDIDGFDTTKDTLILRWSEGDAGCIWGEYESFTLSTGSLNNIGSYTYCDGYEEDPRDQFRNLVAGVDKVSHLIIKNGAIFLPAEKKTLQGRISIRVNTLEYAVSR